MRVSTESRARWLIRNFWLVAMVFNLVLVVVVFLILVLLGPSFLLE